MKRAKTVIVTGATSGIGAAVARAFASSGARVYLVGRNRRKLAAAARKIAPRRLAGIGLADFSSVRALEGLLRDIGRQLPSVDVLVHAAGEYAWTEPGDVAADSFSSLFDVNVRAPYLLTQGLLPVLRRSGGQVIFLNSSVVKSLGRGVAAFKATQHAVQGFVDSLRQDFNRHGVRVSSLYPGRTATPRMRHIYAKEGRAYQPGALMAPSDVARLVVALTELPSRIEVTDVHLRSPTPY